MKFFQKVIDHFFKKKKHKSCIDTSCIIDINPLDLKKVRLNVQGKNNVIKIGSLSEKMFSIIDISIYGDNCSVYIDDNFYTSYGIHILLGLNHQNYGKIENTHLKIGKDTSIESARIVTFNSNCSISIGNECMLSENIMLYNTDSHPIYNKGTGKIINYVKNLTIGDHCWLGMNVKILKNVSIADGCIVGAEAVVTKSILESNCIIAGIPARIVKKGVDWKKSDKNWIKGVVC